MSWDKKHCEDLMKKTIESFKSSLAKLRTGRASPGLIESIPVEAYGQKMKLLQTASIDVSGNLGLSVKVFDASLVTNVEKAIQNSNLGVSCVVEGTVILVKIPRMTEEIRGNIIKNIKKHSEDTKVSLRNVRRDSIEKIRASEKNKEISEDDSKRYSGEVQKLIDSYTVEVDNILKKKSEELQTI